ncbi:MAG: hypothetical protein MUC96_33050 [Myxococcaceae bacterium]|jgi:hypothetical protein|nr:hypothetical protein [Myxococcaceae bacterium]
MAAKKTKTVKKPAAKKAPATKAASIPRVAMKLLETLPPLDTRHRRAYLGAFTDEECEAWGTRTKAQAVLAEAERFVGAVASTLKKPVTGYSPSRLAWLCALVTELHDAVESDKASSGSEARTERAGLFALANKARKKLATGLVSAGTGNEAFLKEVTDRNESSTSAHALESTITGLLQLAMRVRRTETGELLANDAGLTEEFLASVSALADSLREANERTFTVMRGQDSSDTNRVEGRVLREMAFALRMLRRAKEDGESVTLPMPGAQLSSLVSRPATTPPPAPPDAG